MADLDFVPDQQHKAMARASKELGCELPGSLAFTSPMYNHPRHTKANRI